MVLRHRGGVFGAQAPQTGVTGFRLTVTKLLSIVQLLKGEIPVRPPTAVFVVAGRAAVLVLLVLLVILVLVLLAAVFATLGMWWRRAVWSSSNRKVTGDKADARRQRERERQNSCRLRSCRLRIPQSLMGSTGPLWPLWPLS